MSRTTAIIGWSMYQLRLWCIEMGIQWGTRPDVPNDILLLPVGSATVGRMLDRVVLIGYRPGDGETPLIADRAMEWYDCCIRTKRPHGHTDDVIYVPTPEIHRTLESLTNLPDGMPYTIHPSLRRLTGSNAACPPTTIEDTHTDDDAEPIGTEEDCAP